MRLIMKDSNQLSRRRYLALMSAATALAGAPAPDNPVTTIAIECDSEPVQDTIMVRKERLRRGVGV
jgi:hypothetical protein